MKTWISDSFPLKQLECQYFDICKSYKPRDCNFDDECDLRQELKYYLETYVAHTNLKLQIGLILDDRKV